jgi:hypothetical protein
MNSKVPYILGILGLAFPVLGAVTFPLTPSGEVWAVRFAPKTSDYYWDYGARLNIDLIQIGDFGGFGSLLYRSTAGYSATQTVTHFDPIYAFYHQAIGVEIRHWGAMGFVAVHRDCLHDIDRESNVSEFWTTVRIGLGNCNPYRESIWRGNSKGVQLNAPTLQFLYCGWGGPTLSPELLGILKEHNSYKGEIAAMLGAVGIYRGWVATMQGFARMQWSNLASSPHHEINMRLELGRYGAAGSWRLIYGRLFRDTRPIRPADQKVYWGIRFVF